MNENPGGTPNPFNSNMTTGPGPVPGPRPPVARNINGVQPVASATPATSPTPVAGPTPAVNPMSVAGTTPTTSATSVAGSTTVSSLVPADRSMEQATPEPEPVKKKKTGLIVGIIVAIVVLIGVV